jgi:hypothetical protein
MKGHLKDWCVNKDERSHEKKGKGTNKYFEWASCILKTQAKFRDT